VEPLSDHEHDPVPPVRLGGTGETSVHRERRNGRDVVVKRGPVQQSTREARALCLLAGSGVAPALVSAAPGEVVSEFVDGSPRPAVSWTPDNAHAVGAVLARTHAPLAGAGPTWPDAGHGPAEDLSSIRQALGPGAGALIGRAEALVPAVATTPGSRLHGDLWRGNIVWGPRGPVLVDWEFARVGDPAEEFAYLAAMDELDADTLAAVLKGYRADRALTDRVRRWRPLVALWCAAWFSRRDRERSVRLVAHATRVIDREARA
jgi:Ser/Thr protein kinase RdoA (MazF antagonist)